MEPRAEASRRYQIPTAFTLALNLSRCTLALTLALALTLTLTLTPSPRQGPLVEPSARALPQRV